MTQIAAAIAASSAGSPAVEKEPKSKVAAGTAASTTPDGGRDQITVDSGSEVLGKARSDSVVPLDRSGQPVHRRGEHVPVVAGGTLDRSGQCLGERVCPSRSGRS